ncbi:carbonic anhydrase 1-like [Amphiura filiformis]|uniref:carbonic anhydrase 1-like n=1 Tax=Amphiura filiformis TaxID=82378 RepID=UPI003B21C289
MDAKMLILISAVIFGSSLSDAAEWSYHAETGPEYWSTLPGGENCGLSSQSPIDIDTSIGVEQEYDAWEVIGYDGVTSEGPHPANIFNNGHTAQVNLEGDYFVRGGGLPSEYQALQFHLHWGSDSSKGSEHTYDGQARPLRFGKKFERVFEAMKQSSALHIVHYDHVNYPIIPLAIEAPQGLAVMGFFIEVGEHNSAWDPIINALGSILHDGDQYDFTESELFAVSGLIPSDLSKFHRYNGSLTTPGCYESVVWTVFDETIKLSEDQIEAFRGLSELPEEGHSEDHDEEEPIVDNYRPVQPLNTRTLYRGYIPDVAGPSCEGRCGEELDENSPCQCNSVCRNNEDCCEDYHEQCLVEICTFVPTFKDKQRKQSQDTPTRR